MQYGIRVFCLAKATKYRLDFSKTLGAIIDTTVSIASMV